MEKPNAFIDMSDGRYISRIFYVEHSSAQGGNTMSCLYRLKEDPENVWRIGLRLRTYVDDRTGGHSRDLRREWGMQTDKGWEFAVGSARTAMQAVADLFGDAFTEVEVETDDPMKFMEIIARQPWAHIGKMPGVAEA